MNRLFCLVGLTLTVGMAVPSFGDDELPSKIDVIIVSASSSSLEDGASSGSATPNSSAFQGTSSSAEAVSSNSDAGQGSSDAGQSSSSRRSDDDSPLIPVISHDPESSTGETSTAIPRRSMVPAVQGADCWFDLQGRLLKGKPTVQGTYYHNGKAVVIR